MDGDCAPTVHTHTLTLDLFPFDRAFAQPLFASLVVLAKGAVLVSVGGPDPLPFSWAKDSSVAMPVRFHASSSSSRPLQRLTASSEQRPNGPPSATSLGNASASTTLAARLGPSPPHGRDSSDATQDTDPRPARSQALHVAGLPHPRPRLARTGRRRARRCRPRSRPHGEGPRCRARQGPRAEKALTCAPRGASPRLDTTRRSSTAVKTVTPCAVLVATLTLVL